MLKFFSGFFTGIVVVVVAVVCVVFCMPISTVTNMMTLPQEIQEMGLLNNTIIEAGKVLGTTFTGIDKKSILDIETSIGLNIFPLIKQKLGLEETDTDIDSLRVCTIGNLSNGVMDLKINSILKVAKGLNPDISLDANTQEIINPLLDKTIKDISTDKEKVFGDLVQNIKVKNVKSIKNAGGISILPDIPMFEDGEKPIVSLFENAKDLKLSDIFVLDRVADKDNLLIKLKINTVDVDGNNIQVSLYDRPFSGIATDFKHAVEGAVIGDVIPIPKESMFSKIGIDKMTINDFSDSNKIQAAINKLTIADILTKKPAEGGKEPMINYIIDNYGTTTINNIEDTMKNLITKATLNDLKNWGILQCGNLTAEVTVTENGNPVKKQLGECTINQSIEAMQNLFAKIEELQSGTLPIS